MHNVHFKDDVALGSVHTLIPTRRVNPLSPHPRTQGQLTCKSAGLKRTSAVGFPALRRVQVPGATKRPALSLGRISARGGHKTPYPAPTPVVK